MISDLYLWNDFNSRTNLCTPSNMDAAGKICGGVDLNKVIQFAIMCHNGSGIYSHKIA